MFAKSVEMKQTYTMKLYTMCQCKYILVFLKLFLMCVGVGGVRWDNDVYLNDDYRMLWTIDGRDMTIEVQVRTLGYVGLGFSNDGELAGADVAIGWVFNGSPYFQVSFSISFNLSSGFSVLAIYERPQPFIITF